jgi:MFS family permease
VVGGGQEGLVTSMSGVDTQVASVARRGRLGSGFWAVAFAFLIVMSFATLPSPLYGLYRTRDHLSAFMITVVFAIFAVGTISTLLGERFIVARVGRRGAVLGGVAVMMVAAGLLAVWKGLPGLLIGRLLTGVAVGLAAGVAIPYLIELRVRVDPSAASSAFARNVGTSVNVGALGIGPLVAGCLAQWAPAPLTLPYLVLVALGAVALIGVAAAPETGTPAPRSTAAGGPARSRRPVRLPAPAATATIAAFAATGLFAGLSGLLLAATLHQSSHALAGATLFLVYSAGVASQLATTRLGASRVLALGSIFMVVGLALLVIAVRLSAPSLALFLIGGALIGAGAGAIYKGTTGLVLQATEPEDRVVMTSLLVIAVFVGISVPVIGAGVALDQGAAASDTVLVFAILVALGVLVSGLVLLRRQPSDTR